MDVYDVLVFFVTFAVSYLVSKVLRRDGPKVAGRNRSPPAITYLPIVGSLPFIPDFKIWHEFFLKKTDELGGVIGMYIGFKYDFSINISIYSRCYENPLETMYA